MQGSGVRELDLSGRQPSSLTVSLEEHADLEILRLDDNALAMLPAAIGSLRRLREIHLRRNLLPELPAVLWTLPGVETLSLGENPGLSIPDEMAEQLAESFAPARRKLLLDDGSAAAVRASESLHADRELPRGIDCGSGHVVDQNLVFCS